MDLQDDLLGHLGRQSFTHFVRLVLKGKLGRMHQEWIDALNTRKHVSIMSARGHFKTTIMSVFYPLWTMYRSTEPKTILIISATQDQSTEIMGLIKRRIEDTPLLRDTLYPDNIYQTKWSETQILTRNNHRCLSLPFNDAIRGKHCDICISDDILKAEISTDVIDAKRIFYGTVFPTTQSKHGKHIVVGTPIAYTDLLHDLRTKPTFQTLKYPAVRLDAQGRWLEPMFPEHFTLDVLRDIYQTMPRHLWAREYLCEPLSDEVSMFPADLLQTARTLHDKKKEQYDDPTKMAHRRRVLGCDIAVTEGAGHDWSVFTCVEKLDGQPAFIREVRRLHLNTDENIREIERMHNQYNFGCILVERTGVGWSVAENIEQKSPVTKGVGFSFDTKKKSKEQILSRMELAFRNNIIPDKQQDGLCLLDNEVLRNELSTFGYKKDTRTGMVTYASLGEHDDCVMSLALALEALEISKPISLAFV